MISCSLYIKIYVNWIGISVMVMCKGKNVREDGT